MTPGDYTGVALFNFLYYAMIALVSLVGAPILMKMNKGVFMSIGAFLLSGVFIFVYFLGDNLINWIWLLGLLAGLTYGIFYAGKSNDIFFS